MQRCLPTSEPYSPNPDLVRGGEKPYPEETNSFQQRERAPVMAEDSKKKKTSPGDFINQVKSETSKVVWPTWPETSRTAIFVGILVLILSLFFLGVDSLFGWVVGQLLALI